MKIILVGGNIETGAPSGLVKKLNDMLVKIADSYTTVVYYNGVLPKSIDSADLTIWMPEISNEHEKDYPVKKKGSVLICSKVMREGYTHVDSVSRIFKMHGNAVLEVYKGELISLELRDALNNPWGIKSANLSNTACAIMDLYYWTKGSIRKSLKKSSLNVKNPSGWDGLNEFIKLNEELALKVAHGCGNRFFGNYSTRCTKLFPSMRAEGPFFLFSGRNTPKNNITVDDMVSCTPTYYFGDKKPSVDTPVQLKIYEEFSDINYMIHGHAYIKDVTVSPEYFPCGDLREVPWVLQEIQAGKKRLNLKNHGFLLTGKTIEDIRFLASASEFEAVHEHLLMDSIQGGNMKKPRFKKGDTLICVDATRSRDLTEGRQYRAAYDAGKSGVKVNDDVGDVTGYNLRRFSLVPNFKKGDRLLCTNAHLADSLTEGLRYTAIDDSIRSLVKIKDDQKHFNRYDISRFEPVAPNVSEYKLVKPFGIIDIYNARPTGCPQGEKKFDKEFQELLKEDWRGGTKIFDTFDQVKRSDVLMRNPDWLVEKGFLELEFVPFDIKITSKEILHDLKYAVGKSKSHDLTPLYRELTNKIKGTQGEG